LRYNDNEKGGGLLLAWAKAVPQGVMVKEEKVRRRVLKKSKKIVWTYNEKVAVVGGVRSVAHNFTGIGKFLDYKTGNGKTGPTVKQIIDPVMFGSAYATFGLNEDTSKMTKVEKAKHLESKAELKSVVGAVDLDAFG